MIYCDEIDEIKKVVRRQQYVIGTLINYLSGHLSLEEQKLLHNWLSGDCKIPMKFRTFAKRKKKKE